MINQMIHNFSFLKLNENRKNNKFCIKEKKIFKYFEIDCFKKYFD